MDQARPTHQFHGRRGGKEADQTILHTPNANSMSRHGGKEGTPTILHTPMPAKRPIRGPNWEEKRA